VKRFTDVIAQWLSFVYIICAIFGAVFSKGLVCPFLETQPATFVNQRSLTRLSFYFK
jgi:hypothetical protein